MSMSVGAFSGALSSLQSLLKQGSDAVNGAADGTDPISTLLNSLAKPNGVADQAGAAVQAAAKTAGATCSRFSADTMSSLLSVQGQQASGGASGGSGAASGDADAADSADPSTDADGATTVTTTNADGSTTTTTTYADGFQLAATVPAAPTSGSSDGGTANNSATHQADQFAQWLETQAQTLLPAAGALLALV